MTDRIWNRKQLTAQELYLYWRSSIFCSNQSCPVEGPHILPEVQLSIQISEEGLWLGLMPISSNNQVRGGYKLDRLLVHCNGHEHLWNFKVCFKLKDGITIFSVILLLCEFSEKRNARLCFYSLVFLQIGLRNNIQLSDSITHFI